jgi:hypothetical protein
MKKYLILSVLFFALVACKNDSITEQKDIKNILTFVIDSVYPNIQYTYCNDFLDIPISDNFKQIIPQYCDSIFKNQIEYLIMQNKNKKLVSDYIDNNKIKLSSQFNLTNYSNLIHLIFSKPLFSKDQSTCLIIVFTCLPKGGHLEDFLVFKLKNDKKRIWHYNEAYTNINNPVLNFKHSHSSFFMINPDRRSLQ